MLGKDCTGPVLTSRRERKSSSGLVSPRKVRASTSSRGECNVSTQKQPDHSPCNSFKLERHWTARHFFFPHSAVYCLFQVNFRPGTLPLPLCCVDRDYLLHCWSRIPLHLERVCRKSLRTFADVFPPFRTHPLSNVSCFCPPKFHPTPVSRLSSRLLWPAP